MHPYADARVRRAVALACDNAVLLEPDYDGRGTLAENHYVCPIHPEYADIGAPERDTEAARALMEEAGMLGFEHEMFSIDDDWRRDTTDALAAQMRDAGLKGQTHGAARQHLLERQGQIPVQLHRLGHRPLGGAGADIGLQDRGCLN
ncbi:hypothetical protein METH_15250 [Leisingera methylohalidivorans DSM 14336]|uniref:Solute-binding protein family 5 domain-containing protein n=1 Tax=Leisingera methylohalidivorans DSM 14336 TaxID=999552 RepID=V9VWM3_9RHOB|nr:hypothetical protein METH_15250 [Leisingera methylohalidivorans DSM 14336]